MYSYPVLIFLLVILFFIIKGSFGVYQKYSFSKNELKKSESELIVLEEKKSNLSEQVAHLDTETGIEKEIRSKFDVAKEGEKLIVIVDDEVEQEVIVEEKGFVGNFLTTIKGWFQ